MTIANRPAKILKISPLNNNDAEYLNLYHILYQDEQGKTRTWETAIRPFQTPAIAGAVHVLPLIHYLPPPGGSKQDDKVYTVLVEQFRPPLGKMAVELPAGMIDHGETAVEAGLRELREETGLCAGPGVRVEVKRVSGSLGVDPGMTGAAIALLTIDVFVDYGHGSLDLQSDEGENVTAKTVALDDLQSVLKEYTERGFCVDARLGFLATGLGMGQAY